jgi:hypothetical protein
LVPPVGRLCVFAVLLLNDFHGVEGLKDRGIEKIGTPYYRLLFLTFKFFVLKGVNIYCVFIPNRVLNLVHDCIT